MKPWLNHCVDCSWTRHFTLTLSLNLPTQVIINKMAITSKSNAGECPCDELMSIPSWDATEISTSLMDLLAGLCMQT